AEMRVRTEGDACSGAYPRSAVLRRYTVTHSDETGVLTTSVGSEYDQVQLRSLKQRLFRDCIRGDLVKKSAAYYVLHLYAYVAGKYLIWPCPAAVRSYIFQRDINLVVESIVHADAGYLEAAQADTKVLLHLESDSQDFANETILFASVLGDRSTWALGASDSSKLRLTNLWERAAAAAYSFLVLRQDMKNDACGEACNVSCSLDSKDDAIV
ncbi:MAG: staygreen family protein, partial [bacterium]